MVNECYNLGVLTWCKCNQLYDVYYPGMLPRGARAHKIVQFAERFYTLIDIYIFKFELNLNNLFTVQWNYDISVIQKRQSYSLGITPKGIMVTHGGYYEKEERHLYGTDLTPHNDMHTYNTFSNIWTKIEYPFPVYSYSKLVNLQGEKMLFMSGNKRFNIKIILRTI